MNTTGLTNSATIPATDAGTISSGRLMPPLRSEHALQSKVLCKHHPAITYSPQMPSVWVAQAMSEVAFRNSLTITPLLFPVPLGFRGARSADREAGPGFNGRPALAWRITMPERFLPRRGRELAVLVEGADPLGHDRGRYGLKGLGNKVMTIRYRATCPRYRCIKVDKRSQNGCQSHFHKDTACKL